MPPKLSKLATGTSHKLVSTTYKSHGKKIIKKEIKKKPTVGGQNKGKSKKKILPTRIRPAGVGENFIVVWLDSNINLSDQDYQNSIKQLRCIVNLIKTFTDPNECRTFLNQIIDEKIFMIVSGSLGRQIVPVIENLRYLHSIYVFCGNRSKNLLWTCNHPKIKDVFINIEPLCQLLKNDIQQCDTNIMSISILSRDDDSIRDLNSLDSSFMYSKLLKEILMEIEHNHQAKANLVDYCRQEYHDNKQQLKIIDEFSKTYLPSSAIEWYTRECFLYPMLNKALRTQDIEIIIKMGFFLRDLHQQIKELHAKKHYSSTLIVYRGQGMMNEEFKKFEKCPHGLLSFNNFLSTSTSRDMALQFSHRAQNDSTMTPILFQMTIDSSISSTPFTSVNKHGYYYNQEDEILFSMHTVFQIEEIKKRKDGIWKVNLTLTDNNDEQLQKLTDHMRNETNGLTGWNRLGALMIAMGQFDKAQEFYTSACHMASADDWKELAYIHSQLGHIHDENDHPELALEHYNEALDVQLENVPDDDPCLSMTYTGIGSARHSQYQLDEALECFQYALDIAPENSQQDLLQIATIHSHIGAVFNDKKEYPEALHSYEQALDIRQENLPPLHPLLATTYNNIGLVHQSMNDHQKTYFFLQKTLKIELKSLPPNHPSLAVTYHNISKALENLCRYQEAVENQQHAVDIMRIAYKSNNPQRQREEQDLERLQQLL